MKNRTTIVGMAILMALGLMVLLSACGTSALNSQMSYQGRLTDAAGNPITGNRDMIFRLYTSNSGGTPIWEEAHTGASRVTVSNGLFNVVLGGLTPLPVSEFHQPLFLEIVVAGETLSPRQDLLGAPYAFSLAPGAAIKGYIAVDATTGYTSTLNVANFSTGQAIAAQSLSGSAIIGAASAAGDGVYGYSVSGDGVHGKADAAGKSGVYGYSANGFGVTGRSDNNHAVQGISGSHQHAGVYGMSVKGTGVWGEHTDPSFTSPGVYGKNTGSGVGVYGRSVNDHGVYADGAVYGFYTPDKIYAGNGYVDIAEHINAASDVEPGDVVVIDPDHDECVVKSTKPYDTTVAGIISTDPAFLIGNSDTKTPLSLAGRVPCKVSAENGPIHRGDLLTTSSTPGHAMKATELKLGTILGKALGELESGTGVIYVLVTLQ